MSVNLNLICHGWFFIYPDEIKIYYSGKI